MNSTNVQTLGAMVVHTMHKRVQISGVHNTHEEHELGQSRHADGRESVRVGE